MMKAPKMKWNDFRSMYFIVLLLAVLFTNPSMDRNNAMILANYSKKDLKTRGIREAISKKKNRLKEAALSQLKSTNLPPAQVSVTVSENSTLSSVSLDCSTTTTSKKRGSETIITNSMQTKRKKLKHLPQTRATAKCTQQKHHIGPLTKW